MVFDSNSGTGGGSEPLQDLRHPFAMLGLHGTGAQADDLVGIPLGHGGRRFEHDPREGGEGQVQVPPGGFVEDPTGCAPKTRSPFPPGQPTPRYRARARRAGRSDRRVRAPGTASTRLRGTIRVLGQRRRRLRAGAIASSSRGPRPRLLPASIPARSRPGAARPS